MRSADSPVSEAPTTSCVFGRGDYDVAVGGEHPLRRKAMTFRGSYGLIDEKPLIFCNTKVVS